MQKVVNVSRYFMFGFEMQFFQNFFLFFSTRNVNFSILKNRFSSNRHGVCVVLNE